MTKAGYTVLASTGIWILIAILFFLLSGCQLGQTVVVTKGEAGGVVEMWGGQAEYCKITATPGITLGEAERAEFAKFCTSE